MDKNSYENKDRLTEISATHPLEYYTDEKVIPNQKLVSSTIDHFENGQGGRAFKALEFLNLLEKQNEFVKFNHLNKQNVIDHLTALPLSDVEKHILLGFILKWHGGYPVHNMNDEYNETLKLIQKEFLNFPGASPEKEICRVDQKMRNRFDKFGIAFTIALNNGIDVAEILAAMEDEEEPIEKIFNKFDDLFVDAVNSGVIENFKDNKSLLIAQSVTHHKFNVWLQQEKDWQYGDEDQYRSFLTRQIFIEFLSLNQKTEIKSDTASGAINSITLENKEDVEQKVRDMLKAGESKNYEFKSTLRYCIKQQSAQTYIEHSVLKTIAAFLNSEGGTLLIGVDDDSNVLGLDNDYSTFGKDKNGKDEWLKHFDNITAHAFTNALMANIKLSFTLINGKTVAVLDVIPASTQVFMKNKSDANKKQFFIRRNASTVELDAEEMLTYVKQRWNNK